LTPFPRNLRAVLFDADGIIIRSLESHCVAWSHIFRELGVELADTDIKLREGEKAETTFRTLAAAHGLEFSGEEVARWVEAKRAHYRAQGEVEIYPEVPELLSELRRSQLGVGLVTGSSVVNLLHVLTREQLDLFDVMLTAEDFERGKPAAEPYLKGMQALGVTAAEAVVVENAPLGIQAAKAAGVYCIALQTTLAADHLQTADRILTDHAELQQLFQSILGKTV